METMPDVWIAYVDHEGEYKVIAHIETSREVLEEHIRTSYSELNEPKMVIASEPVRDAPLSFDTTWFYVPADGQKPHSVSQFMPETEETIRQRKQAEDEREKQMQAMDTPLQDMDVSGDFHILTLGQLGVYFCGVDEPTLSVSEATLADVEVEPNHDFLWRNACELCLSGYEKSDNIIYPTIRGHGETPPEGFEIWHGVPVRDIPFEVAGWVGRIVLLNAYVETVLHHALSAIFPDRWKEFKCNVRYIGNHANKCEGVGIDEMIKILSKNSECLPQYIKECFDAINAKDSELRKYRNTSSHHWLQSLYFGSIYGEDPNNYGNFLAVNKRQKITMPLSVEFLEPHANQYYELAKLAELFRSLISDFRWHNSVMRL